MEAGMIKAIETVYNGYRFRSRLEARWAVFFDAMGIKWEYEIEGFELGNGERYLPDFWLPELACFVEIKPDAGLTEEVEAVMRHMSDSFPIICFQGMPSPSWNGDVFCGDMTDSSGGAYHGRVGFAWCDACERFVLSFSDDDTRLLRGDRTLWPTATIAGLPWKELCPWQHRERHAVGPLLPHVETAKSARFEFGENGHKPVPRRKGKKNRPQLFPVLPDELIDRVIADAPYVVPPCKPIERVPWKPWHTRGLDWPAVLEAIGKESRTIKGMLEIGADPIAFDGGKILLGCLYPFFKERLEDRKTLALMERVASTVVGNPCQIQCAMRPDVQTGLGA
jgi:hypothetical protein